MEPHIIYLDNAATSWPKPDETWQAMEYFMQNVGANPGRSGHPLSIQAGRIVLDGREAVAELFGVHNPLRIIFTRNATEALNVALYGLLRSGDHVVTSSMEHNSVMRPLRDLEQRGVQVTVMQCSPTGTLDPQALEEAVKENTRLVVITHASNVTGTLMPLAEIGDIARRIGVAFCVDAAQTAGAYPIDVEQMKVDLLAFTGHKSLYGPQGTGGLYIRDGFEKQLVPLMRGGTGSRSESQEQPDFLPDKYESGTLNTIGIAGLGAGVRFVLGKGVAEIREKESSLTSRLLEGLKAVPGVICYECGDTDKQIAVVSFNIRDLTPSEVAMALDEEFHIMSRPGLHCAPGAHRTMGTFPQGTVRLSASYFTTQEHIESAVKAVHKIAAGPKKGG